MELRFERAGRDDVERIFQLSKQTIDDYENIETIDYEKVLKWVRHKIENNIEEYSCIYCNEEKVGYYRLTQCEEHLFELDDLYIFSAFQNQGIGTEVIRKCCKEVDWPVFLYVFIRNERAVALYKRLGFQIQETVKDSRYIMRFDGMKKRNDSHEV